jgi:serine/threonine protein phosphatase PrpC
LFIDAKAPRLAEMVDRITLFFQPKVQGLGRTVNPAYSGVSFNQSFAPNELCSDGLTEIVPDARIAAILQEEKEPRRAGERLVAEANERGGKGNITVVVACF